ncbi:uncharacterized protein LOC108913283 isoform X2 [Anoplophora glabripennis]|nr:uncharacterized protein LOC108913283 isoform X2 [Anoplophora glabripennis]
MTAKKRWLNKIYHDSQDFPKSTQSDISWSSSESDEETRMKKCKVESAKDRWITSNIKHNQKTFPVKMRNDMWQSSNCYQSDAINVWDLNNSAPKVIHTPNATCSKTSKIDTSLRQNCESPIITNMKVEELSPVIVQTRYDFNITKQASPILG